MKGFFFFIFLIILRVHLPKIEARIKLPPNKIAPAVIAFGDSIVDTGNNNNNLRSFARANFPPYGRDFKGGVPTGRFSNGKVPSDLLAEELGIKELLPPYADQNLQPKDLLTGVCFAVGGVGYDDLTSKLAAVPPLSDQLRKFKEYKKKLKTIAGADRANNIIANSTYFVVVSSNDLSNTYFDLGARSKQYNISSYTDLMVNLASKFLEKLYGVGARTVAVFGAPPIGCCPSQRSIGGGPGRHCYEQLNAAARMFNSKLFAALESLNNKKPDSLMVYIDVYNPLLNLIHTPKRYGFTNSHEGCCGSGYIEAAMLCNSLASTCVDDSVYVFWDAFHPTEKAYKVLVRKVLHQYVKKIT